MKLFDFFKKTEKAAIGPIRNVSVGGNINFRSNSIINALGQEIDWNEYRKDHPDDRVLIKPDWNMWKDFYGFYNGADTVVNFVAKTMLGVGWYIKDKNGNVLPGLTKVITERYELTDLFTKLYKHLLVYGIVFITKTKDKNEGTKFICIPASEVLIINGDVKGMEVDSFLWYNANIRMSIQIADDDENDNFNIIKYADIDDQFFGESPLRTYYNIISSVLGDDERFKLYIKQKGNMGLIVGYNRHLDESVVNNISGQLRAFRDDDTAFKAALLPTMGKVFESDPANAKLLEFNQIKMELDSRITPEQRDQFNMELCRSFQIHPSLVGFSTKGPFGDQEFEPAMQIFKNSAFNPLKLLVENKINTWLIPEILKGCTAEELGGNDPSTLTFCIGELQVELDSAKRRSFMSAFQQGIFTAGEVKELAFNAKANENDNWRSIPKGIVVVNEAQTLKSVEEITPEQKEKITEFGKKKSKLSRVPELTKFSEFNEVQGLFKNYLKKEYKIENVKSEEDDKKMYILLLLFFAYLGMAEATRQMEEQGLTFTKEMEATWEENIRKFIAVRYLYLMGLPTEPFLIDDIWSPEVNSLEIATLKDLEELQGKPLSDVVKRVEGRAKLIAEAETAFIFNAGLLLAGSMHPIKTKEWLKTISKHERLTHLATVGTKVPYNAMFTHNDGTSNFWSGEEVNCKCGIKINYA